MRLIKYFFNNTDSSITKSILSLSLLSLILIFASENGLSAFFYKQCVFILLGFVIYFLLSKINIRLLVKHAYLFYVVAIVFLFATIPLGISINGSKRWLDFGFFHLQTSELIKVCLPILLAKLYDSHKKNITNKVHLIAFSLTLIPFIIVLKQPDLGTSLIILTIGFLAIFLTGYKIKNLIYAFISVVILSPFLWNHLKEYQKNRILNLFNPEENSLTVGYHTIQAKIAVGSGGLTGKGFLQGTQTTLDFLPETHTDFIFAVYAEQFGFIGILLLLSLYYFFILRAFKLSIGMHSDFNRILSLSYVMIFSIGLIINIGMVIGIFPIVGVPLPFISYGGSALLTNFIFFGLINNLNLNKTLIAD